MYIIRMPNPTLVEMRPPYFFSMRNRKSRSGTSTSSSIETKEVDTEVKQEVSSMSTRVEVEHK